MRPGYVRWWGIWGGGRNAGAVIWRIISATGGSVIAVFVITVCGGGGVLPHHRDPHARLRRPPRRGRGGHEFYTVILGILYLFSEQLLDLLFQFLQPLFHFRQTSGECLAAQGACIFMGGCAGDGAAGGLYGFGDTALGLYAGAVGDLQVTDETGLATDHDAAD